MNHFASTWIPSFALLLLTVGRGNLSAEEPSSLLANFSFEELNTQTNQPAAWHYWSEYKDHTISAESQNPVHGRRALRVYLPRYGMVQLQQYLAVQPRSKYRLTLATRGAFLGNVAASIEQNLAGFYISTSTSWEFQERWQTHSFEFETRENSSIGVGFRFYGKGVVWLDRVLLEKLGP